MIAEMNVWLWAALALLLSFIPCMRLTFRGDLTDRLVGLEFTSAVVVMELVLLAQGVHHPSFYDIPLTLVVLSFGGGMVFARFVQRWL